VIARGEEHAQSGQHDRRSRMRRSGVSGTRGAFRLFHGSHRSTSVAPRDPFFASLIARSVAQHGTIRLPFGTGRTAADVARVVATVLEDPDPHIGHAYGLPGPRSQTMDGIAQEYSRALGKPVRYVDVPVGEWTRKVLSRAGLPPHLEEHLAVMTRLHRANRYDRLTRTVEQLTGRPAESVEAFVAAHAG
jgi:uncharacterized protein YbjT (DUF2867 family)